MKQEEEKMTPDPNLPQLDPKLKEQSGEEKTVRELSNKEPNKINEEVYSTQTAEGYNINPSEQRNYPGIQDHTSSIIKEDHAKQNNKNNNSN
jgi:hypothetical protein